MGFGVRQVEFVVQIVPPFGLHLTSEMTTCLLACCKVDEIKSYVQAIRTRLQEFPLRPLLYMRITRHFLKKIMSSDLDF